LVNVVRKYLHITSKPSSNASLLAISTASKLVTYILSTISYERYFMQLYSEIKALHGKTQYKLSSKQIYLIVQYFIQMLIQLGHPGD
jgi:hypothetical protein